MAEASASSLVVEASLLLKRIDDLTQCVICDNTLTRQKSLPCFHTFCVDCLQQHYADEEPGADVSCPVCRRIFTIPDDGVEALPHNFFVENLLDAKKISKQLTTQRRCDVCGDDDGDDDDDDDHKPEKPFATSYCGECAQFLCPMCSKYHGRQTATKEHRVVTMDDGAKVKPHQCIAIRCNHHPNEVVKLHCNNCQVVCCLICFAENHKQHDCSHLDKAAEEFRGVIQTEIESVANALCKSEAEERTTDEQHNEFLGGVESAEAAIHRQTTELKQLIDRQADRLLRELRVARQQRDEEVKRRKNELQLNRHVLRDFQNYSQQVKDEGTLVDIASSVSGLKSRSAELLSSHKQIMANRLDERRVSIPARVLHDKVVASIRDEVTVKYKRVQSTQPGVEVRGIALLGDHLYVIRKHSSQIDVLQPSSLASECSIAVSDMTDPGSMAGCSALKSLYITVFRKKEVIKVNVAGAVRLAGIAARWPVNGSPDGVSVSLNFNVVIAIRDTRHLVIFTPNGQMVKEVKLHSALVSPRHAFHLENDRFLLCHGWGESTYGICIVDDKGHILKSAAAAASEGAPKSFTPTHMALDGRGNVLVAEFSGNAIQMYNKQLDHVADVLSQNDGLKLPFRLCVDQKSCRLYVGEYQNGARVMVFSE